MSHANTPQNKENLLEDIFGDIHKSLRAYRFGSWFITSLFYLIGTPNSSLYFKLGVIVALFLSIFPTLQIYEKSNGSMRDLVTTITIESVGIAFLLLPTGGLNSPFVWFALNPVLEAVCFLSWYFCWLNLATYLLISVLTSGFFQGFNTINTKDFLRENLNTLMVFLLITFAFQLYARLVAHLSNQNQRLNIQQRELITVNNQLGEANRLTKESFKQITALYQAVETFCSKDNIEDMINLLVRYTTTLTGGLAVVFWLKEQRHTLPNSDYVKVSEHTDELTAKLLLNLVRNVHDELSSVVQPILRLEAPSGNLHQEILCVPVQSTARYYGVLAVLCNKATHLEEGLIVEQGLSFIARLSSVILERTRLEEIADTLLLSEEQNRIANEIHDTVSQRLFSISFALHSLAEELHKMPSTYSIEQIRVIQKSANNAAKELKASIYGLSSRKQGKPVFSQSIKAYLNELANLNGIKVAFYFNGPEDILKSTIWIAFYRVIQEATGNAIKHGECSKIIVDLRITYHKAVLKLEDNGKGFNYEKEIRKKKGLGLQNMERVARSVNGTFSVCPGDNGGTVVTFEVGIGQGEDFVENNCC